MRPADGPPMSWSFTLTGNGSWTLGAMVRRATPRPGRPVCVRRRAGDHPHHLDAAAADGDRVAGGPQADRGSGLGALLEHLDLGRQVLLLVDRSEERRVGKECR